MNSNCATYSLILHNEDGATPRERLVAPLRHSSPPTGERTGVARLPQGRPANAPATRGGAGSKWSSPKKDTLFLIARRDELYRQLEEANSEVELSHGLLAPFTAVWTEAHNELAVATESRRTGRVVPYQKLIDLYEARRIAGHERHPHKTRADDATKWRTNIMKELQVINAEIGA